MLLVIGLLISATVASAGTLPQPEGRVILEVSGNISNTNSSNASGDGVARFDRAMLEALGMQRIVTTTPWTSEAITFEGPWLTDFFDYVGAGSTTYKAIAHDDYSAEVDGLDYSVTPAILAMKMDGKYMRIRDKGPLWIIFPWDSNPEVHKRVNSALSVWQLKAMIID